MHVGMVLVPNMLSFWNKIITIVKGVILWCFAYIVFRSRFRNCTHFILSSKPSVHQFFKTVSKRSSDKDNCCFISSHEKIQKVTYLWRYRQMCKEKGLISQLLVFGYAESKHQCWQAEKWRFHCLICIFPRCPPNWRIMAISVKELIFRMPNSYTSWKSR